MKRFLLSMLLLPGLAANAQSPKPADPCRYYVALQSAGNWYEMYYKPQLYGTPPNRIKVSPWLLSAGYFLRPRLAVQLSFAYSASSCNYGGSSMADAQGHLNFYDFVDGERRQAAVPLLLRYSLSRRKPRLRADVLLGVVWAYDYFREEAHDVINEQVVPTYAMADQAGNFYVSAGVSARYVFSRHFEAVGDLAFNRNLYEAPAALHQQVTGNPLGLTRSFNLGLRYRFNLRKPVAAPAP